MIPVVGIRYGYDSPNFLIPMTLEPFRKLSLASEKSQVIDRCVDVENSGCCVSFVEKTDKIMNSVSESK